MIGEMELKESIGKGAFGSVYRGVNRQGKSFALKKVSKSITLDEVKKTYFNNEIYLLKQVNNENIIKYVDFKETISNYYLILEYCNGGSLNNALTHYMNKNNCPFPEDIVRFLMKQLIKGVAYLHSNNIIHRDLKSDNILLSFSSEVDQSAMNILKAKVKIIDFGFARYLRRNERASSIIGTPLWMDPIMLNMGLSSKKQQSNYTEKCDIWSLGIIAYQLLIGVMPFKGDNWEKLYKEVANCRFKIPSKRRLSRESITFISRLLTVDEDSRPSADELLTDPFIIGNYDKKTLFAVKEEDEHEIKRCFTDYWKEVKRSPVITLNSTRNNYTSVLSKHKRLETDGINIQAINRKGKLDDLVQKYNKVHTLSIDLSYKTGRDNDEEGCETPVLLETQYVQGGSEAFVLAHNYAKK